ncbi:hypothetical protein NCAS_0C02200 [Naumovozyma castellii]|uniref:PPIase cyclophilin-type domain-containing protein n=1 Tax=Naumovozyma castellii TaxID=27288 RepID=G0VCK0_NAUCA|nr:hypothetical protein NCAS_0C02200 [Naumovozyma castellii CBS 4309]CCC69210.1 hypothetical protein NCAS_0C02200 [Naumovozyma castellii CBS 4309]
MSSALEPQTTAKCIIHTNKGLLNVELWCKEVPRTCHNFLKFCSQGTLKGLSFKQISERNKSLILSVPLPEKKEDVPREYNLRIKVFKDGILCWDTQKHQLIISTSDWGQQTFSNSINIFGKVVGTSIYTFRDILHGELDPEDKNEFLYPAIIENVEVTIPYFDDLLVDDKKRTLINTDGEEDRDIKKLKPAGKIKISYEDEDEDDDDDNELPAFKIKLPQSLQELPEKVDLDKKDDTDAGGSVSSSSAEEEEEEKEIQENTNANEDEPATDRERQTLQMLALFQSNIKNKNTKILSHES